MRLSITTAALALTSAVHAVSKPYNATAEAAIHLIGFTSLDCNGAPDGSPLEMVNGQCVDFRGINSIRPMLWKGRRADWINEVNNAHIHCKLEAFSESFCNPHYRISQYQFGTTDEMPMNFMKCLSPDARDTIMSAKFVCGLVENPELLCTSTLKHTIWSIEPTWGSPVPDVQEVTYTGTLEVTASTPNIAPRSVAVEGRPISVATRGVERAAAPRESKGVWMLHPWTLSMVCYTCYAKKAGNLHKIECRFGHRFQIDCGPKPTDVMDGTEKRYTTTTATTTMLTKVDLTSTSMMTTYQKLGSKVASAVVGVFLGDDLSDSSDSSDDEFVVPPITLHRNAPHHGQSWHTPVKFPHPFFAGQKSCADAEWEKRGQGIKEYIKIQHVHDCTNDDDPNSRWLGSPDTVVHTTTATTTATIIFGHTTTSSSTATVFATTTSTAVIRHDQL
jgi:hypothetical protein